MSETFEHREVIEKIAGPEVEVSDELLTELSELSEVASAEARGVEPQEKSRIVAARKEYFQRLGWTHPESPYYSGYNQRTSKSCAPRPDRLIKSLSKLADQGVDLARITDRKTIDLAGSEKDRLNQAYTYIKRMGEFAVRTATANGIEVEDFNTADLVNRKPYLLLLSREKLGKLARSLFGLEYTSLSTDTVADKVRRNKPGHIVSTLQGSNKFDALPDQLWQRIERFSDQTDKDDIARWYNLGASKITHSNSRQVKEARAQFVNAFLLENTDEKLVEAGKALVRHAQRLGQPLPKTGHIVEVIALLADIGPEKGLEIIKNRPELFYIPPVRIKEKFDALKDSTKDLFEALSESPHLMSLSLPSFLEKINTRRASQRLKTPRRRVNTRSEAKIAIPPKSSPMAGVGQRQVPKQPAAKAKQETTERNLSRIPELAGVDEELISHLKKLYGYIDNPPEFQDFLRICPELLELPFSTLERITFKVEAFFETNEGCTLRDIARIARRFV